MTLFLPPYSPSFPSPPSASLPPSPFSSLYLSFCEARSLRLLRLCVDEWRYQKNERIREKANERICGDMAQRDEQALLRFCWQRWLLQWRALRFLSYRMATALHKWRDTVGDTQHRRVIRIERSERAQQHAERHRKRRAVLCLLSHSSTLSRHYSALIRSFQQRVYLRPSLHLLCWKRNCRMLNNGKKRRALLSLHFHSSKQRKLQSFTRRRRVHCLSDSVNQWIMWTKKRKERRQVRDRESTKERQRIMRECLLRWRKVREKRRSLLSHSLHQWRSFSLLSHHIYSFQSYLRERRRERAIERWINEIKRKRLIRERAALLSCRTTSLSLSHYWQQWRAEWGRRRRAHTQQAALRQCFKRCAQRYSVNLLITHANAKRERRARTALSEMFSSYSSLNHSFLMWRIRLAEHRALAQQQEKATQLIAQSAQRRALNQWHSAALSLRHSRTDSALSSLCLLHSLLRKHFALWKEAEGVKRALRIAAQLIKSKSVRKWKEFTYIRRAHHLQQRKVLYFSSCSLLSEALRQWRCSLHRRERMKRALEKMNRFALLRMCSFALTEWLHAVLLSRFDEMALRYLKRNERKAMRSLFSRWKNNYSLQVNEREVSSVSRDLFHLNAKKRALRHWSEWALTSRELSASFLPIHSLFCASSSSSSSFSVSSSSSLFSSRIYQYLLLRRALRVWREHFYNHTCRKSALSSALHNLLQHAKRKKEERNKRERAINQRDRILMTNIFLGWRHQLFLSQSCVWRHTRKSALRHWRLYTARRQRVRALHSSIVALSLHSIRSRYFSQWRTSFISSLLLQRFNQLAEKHRKREAIKRWMYQCRREKEEEEKRRKCIRYSTHSMYSRVVASFIRHSLLVKRRRFDALMAQQVARVLRLRRMYIQWKYNACIKAEEREMEEEGNGQRAEERQRRGEKEHVGSPLALCYRAMREEMPLASILRAQMHD